MVQCLHLPDIFPHRFPGRQPDRAYQSATTPTPVSAMNVLVKWWVVPTLDYWDLLYSSCITWKPPTLYNHSFFSLKITPNNYWQGRIKTKPKSADFLVQLSKNAYYGSFYNFTKPIWPLEVHLVIVVPSAGFYCWMCLLFLELPVTINTYNKGFRKQKVERKNSEEYGGKS